MREKSKDIKKNFPREKGVKRSNKKIERPWLMQYKWFSKEVAKKHSFSGNPSLSWITHYDKYMDIEHALQLLNRDLRSFSWMKQQWSDRDSRLYNKTTGEILPLILQDNKVIIKEN